MLSLRVAARTGTHMCAQAIAGRTARRAVRLPTGSAWSHRREPGGERPCGPLTPACCAGRWHGAQPAAAQLRRPAPQVSQRRPAPQASGPPWWLTTHRGQTAPATCATSRCSGRPPTASYQRESCSDLDVLGAI